MPSLPPFDVEALRAEFPALRRRHGDRPAAFLDGPGGTQVPQRVIDAVADYYTNTNANAGGAFVTSEASDAMTEEAHAAVADFLGAASPEEIKFGYNMSTLTLHIGRSIGATLGPGRRDRGHDPRPRSERQHLGGDGRRPRRHGPQGRHPRGRRHARPRGPRVEAQRADTKLVAVGYASNAVGTVNPVARDRRAGPRGRRPHLHRCGGLRAARPDRRARARHRLPRLQRLQVVRARTSGRCTARRRCSTACRRSRSARRTIGSRPAPRPSNRSPGRSRRPTTCATSVARTATSPAPPARAPAASVDASSSPG